MTASEPQLERTQQRQKSRFERMGLRTRLLPGGRSLIVSLPLGPAPFESVSGPLVIETIVFATVGADRIKCLRPRPLFGLPLLDIRRCANKDALETTIRQAWRERTHELRETGRTLRGLGIDVGAVEGGSVLAFSLQGEAPEARILTQRLDEAILPSAGPLSGITLEGLEERVVEVTRSLESGPDLDCALGNRIEQLKRNALARDSRNRRERQARGAVPAPSVPSAVKPRSSHAPKVLLVGSKVIEDASLREALKQQGYRAATARSEPEALVRLSAMSPDLVVSQYALGRSDGASFVQATRALPGIERIPVVLLDDAHHDSRRDAARIVGAAGYVIQPIQGNRFVARLGQLVAKPGDRRFTRYPQRLAARLAGRDTPCVATEVGRGGVFITTDEELDDFTAMHCELTLPEIGRALQFDAEVLYRSRTQGATRKGIGLRFSEISAEDEAALIRYLGWIESSR